MGFFRLQYWDGLPFLPPRDLPDPGIEPVSPVFPALQVNSLSTEPLGKPILVYYYRISKQREFTFLEGYILIQES